MLWYLGACQIQIAVPLSFLYSVLLARTLKLKTGLHWRHRKKGLSWMHILQRLNGSHQTGICKCQVRTQPPWRHEGEEGCRGWGSQPSASPLPLELPRSVCRERKAGLGLKPSPPHQVPVSTHSHRWPLGFGCLEECVISFKATQITALPPFWCFSGKELNLSLLEVPQLLFLRTERMGGGGAGCKWCVSSSEGPPFRINYSGRH